MFLDVRSKQQICSLIAQISLVIVSTVDIIITYTFYQVPQYFLATHKIMISIECAFTKFEQDINRLRPTILEASIKFYFWRMYFGLKKSAIYYNIGYPCTH